MSRREKGPQDCKGLPNIKHQSRVLPTDRLRQIYRCAVVIRGMLITKGWRDMVGRFCRSSMPRPVGKGPECAHSCGILLLSAHSGGKWRGTVY
jgi:hypothetical protein